MSGRTLAATFKQIVTTVSPQTRVKRFRTCQHLVCRDSQNLRSRVGRGGRFTANGTKFVRGKLAKILNWPNIILNLAHRHEKRKNWERQFLLSAVTKRERFKNTEMEVVA